MADQHILGAQSSDAVPIQGEKSQTQLPVATAIQANVPQAHVSNAMAMLGDESQPQSPVVAAMAGSDVQSIFEPFKRMTNAEYRPISRQVKSKLAEHFVHVCSPLDKHKNAMYEDVTVLLAESMETGLSAEAIISEELGWAIISKKPKSLDNPAIFNLCLSYPLNPEAGLQFSDPNDKSSTEKTRAEKGDADKDDAEERGVEKRGAETGVAEEDGAEMANGILQEPKSYKVVLKVWDFKAQIDELRSVQIHTGLMAMLGKVISQRGFTYNAHGLFLRIEGVEKTNKRLSCVQVAKTQREIYEYLGLNEKHKDEDFHNWDDVMTYAAGCRFYRPSDFGPGRNKPTIPPKNGQTAKKAKNTMVDHFIKTYLPNKHRRRAGGTGLLSRAGIVDDAKKYFGLQFAARFDRQSVSITVQVGSTEMFRLIRNDIPKYVPASEKTYAVKGWKRLTGQLAEIVNDYDRYHIHAHKIQAWEYMLDDFERGNYTKFREHAKLHWMYVGASQRMLDVRKSATKYPEHIKSAEEKSEDDRTKKEVLLLAKWEARKKIAAAKEAKKAKKKADKKAEREKKQVSPDESEVSDSEHLDPEVTQLQDVQGPEEDGQNQQTGINDNFNSVTALNGIPAVNGVPALNGVRSPSGAPASSGIREGNDMAQANSDVKN